MDIINTLAVNVGCFMYDRLPIWFGVIIGIVIIGVSPVGSYLWVYLKKAEEIGIMIEEYGIVIISVLPVRSIVQNVDEIGIMLEEYEEAMKKDKSKYIPVIYGLIDQYHESKVYEPEYYWDARSDVSPSNESDDDMLNMDYPESKELRRTPNATNLLYLDAVANPPNIRRNPDAADSLALAISKLIENRQAGPALRRHRQRYLPANVQDEYYRPELITIHPPPSERPVKYFYYIVDRRTLPADYQGGVLVTRH